MAAKEPVGEGGRWKGAVDGENIRKTPTHMTRGSQVTVDSGTLCCPFLFSPPRKRNRKDHFQSVSLKEIENISQLHLLVPVLEIAASRVISAGVIGNVSQRNHIPHSLQNYSWQENTVA